MTDFQNEKQIIRDFYHALDTASPDEIETVLNSAVAETYLWRGYHPFNEMRSVAEIVRSFWLPLRRSFSSLQRRLDIFMAGENTSPRSENGIDGVWVASMGHLMGLFDEPWLGIPPTGKIALLRYAEFHRLEDGKITDTALYVDIPHLMMQAGLQPFLPQTGAHLIQPGPMTHEGLMFERQPPDEGVKTLAAIEYMIGELKLWRSETPEALTKELRRSWNHDMIWWGPAGIGATYTIERYIQQHCSPFRSAFKDRKFNGHVCRMAEGHFGGFFGWPNLTLTPTGGFMGMPASEKPADMRVIDIYRRDGDKLTENWIFIDLLHFWNQLGVDILGRIAQTPHS